nr:DMT family transporter [uncultured Rhodoferax sp.]
MTVTHPPLATPRLMGLYLRLTCVPAIWGGTFIAGRIVSAHVPAASAAFIRFVLASLALLLALHLSHGLRTLTQITRRQLLGTMALGATGILAYNLFFFHALANMPAGRTSLIVALNPAITLLAAAVLLGERLSPIRWLGVGLALLGVWIVVTHGDLSQLMSSVGQGELSMLGAVCAWAAYTLIGRRVLQGLSPLLATLWASMWGALFLGVLAVRDLPTLPSSAFTASVWASLVFLGVLGTAVGFVWYYEGITKLGAARTVVFNNLVPIFGVLLGWIVLDESVSTSVILGGGMAIAGIFLVNRVKASPPN